MEMKITKEEMHEYFDKTRELTYEISGAEYDVIQKWISLYKRGKVFDDGYGEYFSGYEDGLEFVGLHIWIEDPQNIGFRIYYTKNTIDEIRKDEYLFNQCLTNGDVNHNLSSTSKIEEVKSVLDFFTGKTDIPPFDICGLANSCANRSEEGIYIDSLVAYAILKRNGLMNVFESI